MSSPSKIVMTTEKMLNVHCCLPMTRAWVTMTWVIDIRRSNRNCRVVSDDSAPRQWLEDHQAWEIFHKITSARISRPWGCKWHCGMNHFSRAFAVEKCLRVCSSNLLASVDVYQAPLWVSCFKSLSLGRINLHIYCFFPFRRRLFTLMWKSLVIKRSFVHLLQSRRWKVSANRSSLDT